MSEESKKPAGAGGGTGWKGALDSAKDVALEIYRDGFKESVQVLGHALATTVRVATSPIVFALSHAENATKRLFENADRKLAGVPPEARLLVDPNISAPIILNHALLGDREGAEELRDMYASQLASAIDPATASGAHPSYTQIIAGLSKSEAQLVQGLARDRRDWPMVHLQVWKVEGREEPFHIGPYYWTPNIQSSPLDIVRQVDNLTRLGLLVASGTTGVIDQTYSLRRLALIERLESWDGLKGLRSNYSESSYYFTLFGQAFASVCVRD